MNSKNDISHLKKLKLVSLFDGIGCFPLAWAKMLNLPFKDLNYVSSEITPFLLDILKEKFPKSEQLGDIEKVDLNLLNGDVITMGTPCTGFSISGNGDGLENIESRLFKDGVEAVKAVQPNYFVWENVFGVFSAGKRKEFKEILAYFKETGYDLAWTLLDTKYFGLPQRRRRLYMIGVKNGIPKNNNLFDFKKRQSKELQKEVKLFENNFEFDFDKSSTSPEKHFAFFNRQRSDKFKEIGISNTIAKRDFKGATDVVIKNGRVRRVVPKERLRLQGIPDDFFDNSYTFYKSDKPRYQANGMSVPVVSYVFEQIQKIETNDLMNDSDYEKDIVVTTDIRNELTKTNKSGVVEHLAIPYSGQMFFKRDEEGNILDHDEVEFHFAKKCIEGAPELEFNSIEDFLLDEVEEKYYLTEKTLEGYLRREYESGNLLPEKLKEVILHQYPNLIEYSKELDEKRIKESA